MEKIKAQSLIWLENLLVNFQVDSAAKYLPENKHEFYLEGNTNHEFKQKRYRAFASFGVLSRQELEFIALQNESLLKV